MIFKPDYGALLHSQNIGRDVKLCFYNVILHEVAVTDEPGLTAMLEIGHEGEVYAVSFDFTDDAAAELLARCEPGIFRLLTSAANGRTARERTVSIQPPVEVQIEATLGTLQRSAQEVFAPLVVHHVS